MYAGCVILHIQPLSIWFHIIQNKVIKIIITTEMIKATINLEYLLSKQPSLTGKHDISCNNSRIYFPSQRIPVRHKDFSSHHVLVANSYYKLKKSLTRRT